jgi:hypothetical protein
MPARQGVRNQPRLSWKGRKRRLIYFTVDMDVFEKIAELSQKEGVSYSAVATCLFEGAWRRVVGGEDR